MIAALFAWIAVMGFEQLAGLKEQLSELAKTRASARRIHARKEARIANAKTAANAKRADPVLVTIGRLQKRFPAAFPKNPAPKVPLKVGIFEDLISHTTELKLSHTELRDAIKIWCRGNRYWTALVNNAIRVDLSGAEAGRVSPEDAGRAQKLEEARLGKVAAKAAAAKTTS
jgi:ProP effector